MALTHFSYRDTATGWELSETTFGRFNLLVGLSGVGKSWTLDALQSAAVCTARPRAPRPDQAWELRWAEGGRRWTWSVEVGSPLGDGQEEPSSTRFPVPQGRILAERIELDGAPIVERTEDTYQVRGATEQEITSAESAVRLFRKDADVAPLFHALQGIAKVESALTSQAPGPVGASGTDGLDDLRRQRLPLARKAWFLQEEHPAEFAEVVELYRAIFPMVENVRFEPMEVTFTFGDGTWTRIDARFTEAGVPSYTQDLASEGMSRALVHLLELRLAPPGAVLLIDEIEDSLGANCLPQIADELLHARSDFQIIATSHHPYLINNVPRDRWRVVTRQGTRVQVRPARDFPELDTDSAQDAFVLLQRWFERQSQP